MRAVDKRINGDRHRFYDTLLRMARSARTDVGDCVYHVINRATGRARIFHKSGDYKHFLALICKARDLTGMRILSFVIMPNHWHLELYPRKDKDLALFMHALTNTHTRCVRTRTDTIGIGPLYQGRYKSFLIEDDKHLLTVLKYIERNPIRAKLAERVEDWKWGSAWIRQYGTAEQKRLLDELPIELPKDYVHWVNTPDKDDDIADIRTSVNRGTPFGRSPWIAQVVKTYGLQATVRKPGRPRKG